MSSDDDFQLFTSLRYDPLLLQSEENSRPDLNFITPSPFYMLAYHRSRMVEAAQHFDFHAVEAALEDGIALHNTLLSRVEEWQTTNPEHKTSPLKIRILFDKSATMTVDCMPTPPLPLSTLYPTSFDPPPDALHPQQPHPANPSPSPQTSHPQSSSSQQTSSQPPAPQWTLSLDTHPTPSSPLTLLKTTSRSMYNHSRARALPTNPLYPFYAEVILYNDVRELTEGTLTSLYLYRGGRWVTPPVGVPSGEFTAKTLKEGLQGDEGELRMPFAGRWGHSVRSAKVGAGGQRGTSRRWALGKGFCMEEPVGVETVEVGEGVWVSSGVRGFGFGRVVAVGS